MGRSIGKYWFIFVVLVSVYIGIGIYQYQLSSRYWYINIGIEYFIRVPIVG